MASDQTRDGKGKFRPTTSTAARQARAAELFDRGLTYRAIAADMGIDIRNAYDYVQAAMLAVVETPGRAALQMQLGRLEAIYEQAAEVMARQHPAISYGKVVRDDNDQVLLDDGPRLAAMDRMIRVIDGMAKLHGLYAAVKVDHTVHEVTPQDLELQDMVSSLKAKNAAVKEQLRGAREHPE